MTRPLILGGRWLMRRPLTSLISVTCLAIGIAACAVALTLIDAAVLRPFGLTQSHRLVVVWETDPARQQPLIEVSYLNFLDWQREARTVDAMATFGSQHWPALARIGQETLPIAARAVSVDFFRLMGVQPVLGRSFEPDDAALPSLPPLILSHRFWQARFGSSRSIVGERVFVDGTDNIIVGVMPAGFAYPDDPDVWVSVERVLSESFQSIPVTQQRLIGVLEVLARRKPSVTQDEVRTELTSIIQGLQRRHSSSAPITTRSAVVTPFADAVIGRLGGRLWIALGMATAVWLLACANVAAVRAAHLRERGAELAARLCLGATRTRLSRELALESVVLVAAGAGLGVVAWSWLIGLVSTSTAVSDSGITLRGDPAFAALLLATLAVSSWLIAGVWPGVVAARQNVVRTQESGSRVAGRTSRIGAPLLAAQSVLAIAVVALSAVALQTFTRLSQIDFGFAMTDVTLVDVAIPQWKYGTPPAQRRLMDQLQDALRAVPDARYIAAVSVRPFRFGEIVDGLPVRRGGDTLVQPEGATGAGRVAITPDYFDALGQPIVSGRRFSTADRADTDPVVIISRTLAQALFGDRPAVGERIETFSLSEKWRSRVIVGIAGDARYRGLERPSMEVYVPHTQSDTPLGSIVVSSASALTERTVREALFRVEPELAVERVQTTDDLAQSVLSPQRLLTMVVSLLGAAGLLLLTLGVFGAAATAMRSAWQEIAIRQAVGALPFQAARAPLRTLTRALLGGIVAGLLLSPLLMSAAVLVGLEATESVAPLIGAASAVLMAAALGVAPALWRAAKTPPSVLLRQQ